MTSVHEDMAEAALKEFLSNREGIGALGVYCNRLISNGWEPYYLDSIGQFDPREPGWKSLPQITSLALAHHEIMDGRVATVDIGTRGHTPMPDACRRENAAALSDLHVPFVAEVDQEQNCADDDGLLRWTEPITAAVSSGFAFIQPDGEENPVEFRRTLPPGRVPLEIGTTKASKTLWHLDHTRGVARWPYGHRMISLMVRVEERWFAGFPAGI